MEVTDDRVVLEDKGFEEAHRDEQEGTADENVGGNGKDRARLAHAAQVHHHDQQDQRHIDAYNDQRRGEDGEERGERLHTSGHADRDSEDVIDHERGGGNQPRHGPQVVFRHDIGPAAIGVGRNRLTVGKRHDTQQSNDGNSDGEGQPQIPRSGDNQGARMASVA